MDHESNLAIRELLPDLGWLPSDLNCEEKKHLAERVSVVLPLGAASPARPPESAASEGSVGRSTANHALTVARVLQKKAGV
jgi:hypothetical protein